jgi:hypothetical protein
LFAPSREIKREAEADHRGRFSPPGTVVVEVQDDGNRWSTSTTSHQPKSGQYMDMDLLAALLSLTATMFEVSQVQDLVQLVDAIAPVDAAFTFAGKLIEMVKRNTVERTDFLVDDWSRILKPITKMVISMVRHRSISFAKEDDGDLESLIDYLHSHSTGMNKKEGVMSLAHGNHGAKQPFKTLASLVKEAQELWDKQKEHPSSVERNQIT